ncbi:MAG TPA: hypothetical protein VJR46_06225 [Candidatus Dormibacteraeota bacterium]|nr:hypothetical protein [Candidatus Dormibacteraeota bacterium]
MRLLALAFALLLGGCSGGGQASTTPSPSGSPLAQAPGKLGTEVPMPPSFPSDVPVYPKARLTAAAGFPSSGPTSWGMEWQTLDSVPKVQAFYTDKLNQGDWQLTVNSTANGEFKATFRRKSNGSVQGTLACIASSGVTKILMSLVTPAA